MAINWSDKKSLISKYFTVSEATFLPSWNVYLNPSDEEKENILAMAVKMDMVREILGVPIKVHCWIRPETYNRAIGGAPQSAHISGRAVDFSCQMNPDAVRYMLLPHLPSLALRMENLKGAAWVHLGNDWKEDMQYFFKP